MESYITLKKQSGDCKSWKTELSYNGETFQEIDIPHDVYHQICPGSIIKYEKGQYVVVEGESIFDLYKNLPIDEQYCKMENVYYTPKGKLTKNQLEALNEMQNEKPKEKSFFEKIYDKLQEFKQKIMNMWK